MQGIRPAVQDYPLIRKEKLHTGAWNCEVPCSFCSIGNEVWKNLDAINHFCSQYPDVHSYLMLAPDAASVQKERLPKYVPVAEQEQQLQTLQRYQEEQNSSVTEIPLYETLRAHKDEYLYYRSDHHWTTLGAWYAYEKAAEVMNIPGVAEKAENIGEKLYPVTAQFQGTLSASHLRVV